MISTYCDTSSLKEIKESINKFKVRGITTNPSLMRQNNVNNYKLHCKKILKISKNLPVSFEVFGDDKIEIYRQAKIISSWGKNVFVKIPIINTKKKFMTPVIKKLHLEGIKINVTAIFTLNQINKINKIIKPKTDIILSIFSGRIADNGIDPEKIVKYGVKIFKNKKNVKILWASCRENFNYYQAKRSGCKIITIPLKFIKNLNKKKISLEQFSLNTVKQFFDDGKKARFKI